MIAALKARVRRSRRLKFALVGAGLLGCLGITLGLGALAASRVTPAWAERPPGTAPAAEALENAVLAQLTAVRPADPARTASAWSSLPWSVSVQESDARAWMEHRLEAWLVSRRFIEGWPAGLSHPVVAFDEGVVRVGAWVGEGEARPRLVFAELVPSIDAQGALRLTARRAGVGCLALPGGWAIQPGRFIPADVAARPDVARWLACLTGDVPLAPEPIVPLDAGRRVRLVRLVPHRGRLDVTCRTEVAR